MAETSRYAVVDIETTGGVAGRGRITEVAIIVLENGVIVDEFVSLINPEQAIPPYITRLTGITNEMTAGAPRFYEVARKIVEITNDAIFVAHNAAFDYNFIRKEFESLGYDYTREVLCTVRLSRKIIPGHATYSLGSLCRDLGIPLSERHRAGGDARATALLLLHLFEKHGFEIKVQDELDVKGLHPALSLDAIRTLPHKSGVYYFHNQQGDVIYVGKSKNIYRRVLSHLSAKGKRSLTVKSQLTEITCQETGSELLALLKEQDEIKRLKPLFNRAGRRTRFNWGLYNYMDRSGYERFFVQRVNGTMQPLDAFASREEARVALYRLAGENGLCHRLAGLEDKEGTCFNFSIKQCKGACGGFESPAEYNLRAAKLKTALALGSSNFVLFDTGRVRNESSFVWVEKNVLRGYGWIDSETVIQYPSQLENYIAGGCDNSDTRRIVRTWVRTRMTGKMKLMQYE